MDHVIAALLGIMPVDRAADTSALTTRPSCTSLHSPSLMTEDESSVTQDSPVDVCLHFCYTCPTELFGPSDQIGSSRRPV